MHTYAALLGHQPAISIAELSARLPDFTPLRRYGDFLTFQTSLDVDDEFLRSLGGTVLFAKDIIGSSSVTLQDVPSLLATELQVKVRKPVFSLRFHGISKKPGQELFKECKEHLRRKGTPSRYIGNPVRPALPIQLHDEGVLDPAQGCELVILRDQETLWVGRTIAAQDVKSYTQRDIGKPVRDTETGLLPPKLAQILLSFGTYVTSGKWKVESGKYLVFDPFCGTGVIPLEALVQGHTVLASDVSLKAVNGTTKNIEWARKTYKIAKKDVSCTIWKQDALKPFALKDKPTVIVTEGTLGPPLKNRPTIREAEKLMHDGDALTAKFLANCAATLPGVPVVMTLPVWYAQKKMVFLEKISEEATKLGFRFVLPPHTSPAVDGRFSLLYRRPDQMVGREIVMLQPKN